MHKKNRQAGYCTGMFLFPFLRLEGGFERKCLVSIISVNSRHHTPTTFAAPWEAGGFGEEDTPAARNG